MRWSHRSPSRWSRQSGRGQSHGSTWARRISDPRPCAPRSAQSRPHDGAGAGNHDRASPLGLIHLVVGHPESAAARTERARRTIRLQQVIPGGRRPGSLAGTPGRAGAYRQIWRRRTGPLSARPAEGPGRVRRCPSAAGSAGAGRAGSRPAVGTDAEQRADRSSAPSPSRTRTGARLRCILTRSARLVHVGAARHTDDAQRADGDASRDHADRWMNRRVLLPAALRTDRRAHPVLVGRRGPEWRRRHRHRVRRPVPRCAPADHRPSRALAMDRRARTHRRSDQRLPDDVNPDSGHISAGFGQCGQPNQRDSHAGSPGRALRCRA